MKAALPTQYRLFLTRTGVLSSVCLCVCVRVRVFFRLQGGALARQKGRSWRGCGLHGGSGGSVLRAVAWACLRERGSAYLLHKPRLRHGLVPPTCPQVSQTTPLSSQPSAPTTPPSTRGTKGPTMEGEAWATGSHRTPLPSQPIPTLDYLSTVVSREWAGPISPVIWLLSIRQPIRIQHLFTNLRLTRHQALLQHSVTANQGGHPGDNPITGQAGLKGAGAGGQCPITGTLCHSGGECYWPYMCVVRKVLNAAGSQIVCMCMCACV